ncbi:MAG: 4Fe-4S dicluster domain-containing protein [Alphaproteobacteria bacterium]|nr:4Fe-4S dicluster domain-containing protein [Alphaproteobacteria bacterium]
MRQVGYVFDLNKCIGCHTCTMACKQLWTNRDGREYMYWNNVETRPGTGYPKNWEQKGGGFDEHGQLRADGNIPAPEAYGEVWNYNFQEVLLDGTSNQVVPDKTPTAGPNWDEDQGKGKYPNGHYFYLPRICNHCSNPACLAACPRQAIYKRPEDGLVVLDQKRCRGYQYCVKACPYGKVYFNLQTGKSAKCIGCYPRIEKGEPPACVKQCTGRVRFWGYRDDTNGPIYKLVDKWKVALPLHAEYGTEPNVFYVPPINTTPLMFEEDGRISAQARIPIADLEALFGKGVGPALATLGREMNKRRQAQPSELTDILIGYTNKDRFAL